MNEPQQTDLFRTIDDVDLLRWLIADLHDDLSGRLGRFRQLIDISASLGTGGTLMPGGETAYNAWQEARTSFVHGNYIATVMLCQGLVEHILAAQLELVLGGERLPDRIQFKDTIERCVVKGIVSGTDAVELRRLMNLRNPLSHYRSLEDSTNLSRRVLDSLQPADSHLLSDASIAISIAVRVLALPSFRVGSVLEHEV